MKRSNQNRTKKQSRAFGAGLEQLETRQMYSANPAVSFYEVPIGSGAELVCQMNDPSVQMSVVRSADGIQFNVEGDVEDVVGNFSYLSIIAQSGDNSIVIGPNMTIGVCAWGGSGTDLISTGSSGDALRARSGNDTLIALGGENNLLFGGSGYTNFWATGGNYYFTGSGQYQTHFFNSFINSDDTTLDGQLLSEPGTDTTLTFSGTWQNYSGNPLFSSAGPLFSDITQGACGDCYFISGLASVALTDPQQIKNIITPLGDGTYAEQFSYNGQNYFVRVDAELPTNDDGSLFYAGLGAQGSTWVALMEKGWAYMESYENGMYADYYSPDQGGNASIALNALGGQNEFSPNLGMFGNSYYFAGWINWQLQQGKAMEIGFRNDISGILYGDHEYSIISATYDSSGQVNGLWVRNPWGIDVEGSDGTPAMASAGHNDGSNDGLVWIDASMAFGDADDIGAAFV